ncbi:MAG: SLC13 family permease [Anaerovoracaceae bacterium]|jgi:sodium-dependent dicarboxylate transporter 2/3/5
MASSTIAMIIIVATIILFATELVPLPVTAISACLAMGIFNVIPLSSVFSGFGNDVVFLVAGAIVIGEALFETGAAIGIGKRLVKLLGTNEKIFLMVCIAFTGALSAFLSNTATVAMMMPIIASAAMNSKGKITKKNTYMAVGFASVAGGACTLVGSTPQLIAQGVLLAAGLEGMKFFDLAYSGIPKLLLMMLYYYTIGYALQKRVFDFDDVPDKVCENGNDNSAQSPVKMWISVAILFGCVVGFVSQIWTVGIVAMVGAVLCVVTKCISIKQVFARMDWTTVVVLGGALGFASGVEKSGAGEIIAHTVIGWLGEDVSTWVLLSAIALIACVMGNLMSHTATAAILAPICLIMARNLAIEPLTMMIVIVMSVNMTYITPISTPPNTMTLIGGYRFMDYVRVGTPLNILMYFLNIMLIPILFDI